MKTILNFTLAIVLILAVSCSTKKDQNAEEGGTLKGRVSISGAFALYPLANVWAEEFNKLYPDVRINISAGGAGKGMADALSGAADLGMFSREITPAEVDKGVWWVGVAKDAVLPTINAQNPELATIKEKGLTQEAFQKIFITQDVKTWGKALGNNSQEKIGVYTRSDAAGAAATWAQYLGASGQEELKGVGVFGDPGLADAVRKDKNGIGFNNVIYVYDLETGKKYPGIDVVPIDINEDGIINADEMVYDNIDAIITAIGEGKYPSPPARELYFVSKGKPENVAALRFLEWVLTKGQKYVGQAGYIQLSQEKINRELKKLNDNESAQ